ncbi:MAG TPA: glycosyltransferase family 2 protein [Thermoanaerobaculia bacterium]|jgi:glycosyltransferase involved in cell wall biosynthesis|nr:glycosyltransferase family 2 protein [Thermoanaerobaculia bacterium]
MTTTPRVSVVIGAYDAAATVAGCLEALRRQTYRDFEVVLIDSSPDQQTVRIASAFSEIVFEHSASRLYCHEARNRAIGRARGELLACLDADVYPRPEWLAELVAAYERTGQVIVGALACHGSRLRDRGIHLCKFAKFLPGGAPRAIDTAPTANLLVARHDFERAGGLRGERYLADVTLGRELVATGRQLLFVGTAVAAHHHTQSLRAFLTERYVRGVLFGKMRGGWLSGRAELALFLAASVFPVRLVKITGHVIGHCIRGRQLTAFLITFPIVLAGHAAWLAGESVSYARALVTLWSGPAVRSS